MLLLGTTNNEEIDGGYIASETFNRAGLDAGVVVFWYKYGGIVTPKYPTNIFHYKRLCQITEISNPTGEPQDDRETFEVGKRTKRVNDGVNWSFDTTFKGNEISALLTFSGRHAHNTSSSTVNISAGIEFGKSLGVQGAIIMLAQSSDHKNIKATVIPDCEPSIFNVAGVGESETTYSVNFTSKSAPIELTHGFLPVPFIFFDDGVGTGNTNTAAPDGSLLAFAVKDANGAFASVPSYGLLSQVVRHNATTNFDKYVIEARLGPVGQVNSKLQNSAVTYTPATSTLTFTTEPTDGHVLEGIVAMPAGSFPDWNQYETYHVGDVVKNASAYWVCAPGSGSSTTEEPTGTPTDWSELTDQLFPAPYYPTAVAWDAQKQHRRTAQKQCAVLSWTDFQLG